MIYTILETTSCGTAEAEDRIEWCFYMHAVPLGLCIDVNGVFYIRAAPLGL